MNTRAKFALVLGTCSATHSALFITVYSFLLMDLLSKRIGLPLLLVATILMVTGCNEALLSDNSEENSYVDDVNGTPFIEFQSGSRLDTVSVARGDTEDPQVGPNVSLDGLIEYQYEFSSPSSPGARENLDYTDITPNTPEIPAIPDSVRNSVEVDTVEIEFGAGGLTEQSEILIVELTSVSITNGLDIQLGRAGTEVGRTRQYKIPPSVSVSEKLDFGTISAGTSADSFAVVENNSVLPTTAENFSITGADAGAFSVQGIGNPSQSSSTLSPSSEKEISLTFSPSSAGTKTAELTFDFSNSADGISLTVPLEGVAQ